MRCPLVAMECRSFDARAGSPDQRRPLLDLRLDEGAVFVGPARGDIHGERAQLLLYVRPPENFRGLLVQLRRELA